jgi:serine/threonine protein kinase
MVVLGGLLAGDPTQIGPYRLLDVLGSGGFGRVFLGMPPDGRLAAVKVIRPELAADPEFRARFRREVAAARRVSGQFTAQVIDADAEGPVPWLATAYVSGPSLAKAVAMHGPLPVGSVLALAAGLTEALAAIHAAGLVHRDLKPDNVLLAEDGPRVIDFGIARTAGASTLTDTGVLIGTLAFMSPEQVRAGEVGPASDVFSLGSVLVFAATGEGPFGMGPTAHVLYRVAYETPSLDRVPQEIRPLVQRCLAPEPGHRPTPGDLLAELRPAKPTAGWLPAAVTRDVLSRTDLTADWLPERIVRDLPRYAVSDYSDSGGAVATGASPGQGASGDSPERDVPYAPRTGAAAAASAGPGQTPGPPLPGGVSRDRQRGGRRRLALASVAVVLAASAGAVYGLGGSPAAAHPQLSASRPATSRSATSRAPTSRAPTSRGVSASPDQSPSVPVSGSTGSQQRGSGKRPSTQDTPTPAVLASVSSAYAALDGYVFVTYLDGTDANAAVSGQVTNAVSGEVARLYAQQFPFTSPAAPADSAALDPSGTTAQYSFQVTPTLATRYTVEVFRNSTATTPLATSATGTVYVAQKKGNDSTTRCSGSQCQLTDTATVLVPASVLSTQMAEHDYPYFGISYAASGKASIPATLQLGAGDPVVGSPQQVSADEYQFTLTWSFSTNNESYAYSWHNCTVSVEAQDGIGLPGGGDYGCGSPTIPETEAYIG